MTGMTYYLTLWYPPHRIAHRIGWYFTAAQLSAAVVGLVSAGFQKMNRDGGLRGYAWYTLLILHTNFQDVSHLWHRYLHRWCHHTLVAPRSSFTHSRTFKMVVLGS